MSMELLEKAVNSTGNLLLSPHSLNHGGNSSAPFICALMQRQVIGFKLLNEFAARMLP